MIDGLWAAAMSVGVETVAPAGLTVRAPARPRRGLGEFTLPHITVYRAVREGGARRSTVIMLL